MNVPQQVARPIVQVESFASAPTAHRHTCAAQGRAMEVLVSLKTHAPAMPVYQVFAANAQLQEARAVVQVVKRASAPTAHRHMCADQSRRMMEALVPVVPVVKIIVYPAFAASALQQEARLVVLADTFASAVMARRHTYADQRRAMEVPVLVMVLARATFVPVGTVVLVQQVHTVTLAIAAMTIYRQDG